MTVFASGISMNALAKLLTNLLPGNWNAWELSVMAYLWICSGVVLLYVLKGGLTSAIYTEVLQFFMIVLGFAPVVYLGLKDIGGWHVDDTSPARRRHKPVRAAISKRRASLCAECLDERLAAGAGRLIANPLGVDWFAMVFGLGFVLSFGYWCTNFLVVQRAMAAKNMTAARNTPLVAAMPKMLFPVLVILPGMIAIAMAATPEQGLPHPAAHHRAGRLYQGDRRW